MLNVVTSKGDAGMNGRPGLPGRKGEPVLTHNTKNLDFDSI